MVARAVLRALLLLQLAGLPPATPGGEPEPPGAGRGADDPVVAASVSRVPAVLAEVDRLAQRPLWPGFEPRTIPIEIFDGRQTWLFRHPSPPREFTPVPGRARTWIFRGRHDSVRANESTELAGVLVAVASLESRREDAPHLAALILHESFHVFQARHHPAWGGNEVDLFLYPTDDAEALAGRRLESRGLERALGATSDAEAARWAAEALALRQRRFARMPASAASYERGSEMKEGLARYIEAEALGSTASPFPAEEFPPAAVRDRAYASGCAIALLLDRLDPGWKPRVEDNGAAALDDLLARAVAGAHPREFARTETDEAMRRAVADVAGLAERRVSMRREFLAAPGWKIVVEAPTPLFPQAFDPLNFELLSPTEVLHTRWLKLGNASGSIEVLGRASLTEAAGKHPLFQGLRRLTITGLSSEPHFAKKDGHLTFSAEGVVLDLYGAQLIRSEKTTTVELK